MSNQQNLARQRALAFGKSGINEKPHLMSTPSSSVVVTTTSDHSPQNGIGFTSSEESEDFSLKPRGFFADQFEVCFVSVHPIQIIALIIGMIEQKQPRRTF